MPVTIYHNNRCSKSRDAITILDEQGIDYKIVPYLVETPDAEALTKLIKKLKMKPEELVRKSEDVYKEMFRDREMTDEEWIAAMVAHPQLIERPIVVNGRKAVVARPPEKVLEIL
jgi:arsenate reductase